MDPKLTRNIAATVAILVIIGFAVLYGYAFWRCWRHPESLRGFPRPEYVYVATALAGLVGAVVAMIFNEKLSTEKPLQGKQSLLIRTPLNALLASLTTGPNPDPLEIVSVGYVLIYFAAGVAAIVTWIIRSDSTPDLVKNLALISIGLFVAIARSFFNLPKPK